MFSAAHPSRLRPRGWGSLQDLVSHEILMSIPPNRLMSISVSQGSLERTKPPRNTCRRRARPKDQDSISISLTKMCFVNIEKQYLAPAYPGIIGFFSECTPICNVRVPRRRISCRMPILPFNKIELKSIFITTAKAIRYTQSSDLTLCYKCHLVVFLSSFHGPLTIL